MICILLYYIFIYLEFSSITHIPQQINLFSIFLIICFSFIEIIFKNPSYPPTSSIFFLTISMRVNTFLKLVINKKIWKFQNILVSSPEDIKMFLFSNNNINNNLIKYIN